MKPIRKIEKQATAAAFALMLLAGWGNAAAQADSQAGSALPSLEETKAIAEEGFLYGLPIVANYAVMYEFSIDKNSSQFKAPFNILNNEARVATYKDTAVVTPNSDTPYSTVWFDLRSEPMVISIPEVDKDRYYSVQLIDGNTYNYGYIGSRATGHEAGNYLVAGPDWQGEAPAGISKVFHSSTPFGLTLFRTQLFNPADMPNVVKVQAGYKVQPLSAFMGKSAPAAAPELEFLPATTSGIKKNFYKYLDVALQFVPETELNKDIRAKLATIGIGPGKTIDFEDLSLEHKTAVLLGMKAGDEKVSAFVAGAGKDENGWQVGGVSGGDEGYYNNDWLKRAATASAGLYANDFAEATYPLTRKDINGNTLDTSKHKYTLTFPAGDFPPVNAFWSVTMYDGESQLLIENPINRYLINSPMLPDMKTNKDGSLTIYIQKDNPGKDKEANWLPAPNDTAYLVMRLYWPRVEAPSILPPGKGSWKPPGIVVAE
ncbi:Uncharacterised protein [Halioglobus japonicus]|nr:Uncharacterised protein [Halioglobus japonicus]